MGNGQRALAQTALMMVGASEIGGSRLTLDELSPDSPLSVTTTRPRETRSGTHYDGRRRRPPTTIRWQVGRAFSFSHYTTEGIFIHGDPPLGSFLEPPRQHAAAPRRRRARLEWEFSLPLSGNCPAAARNRGSGKIPWPSLALGVSTLPDANALYREERAAGLFPSRSKCRGRRSCLARAAGRRASSAGRGSPYPAALGSGFL